MPKMDSPAVAPTPTKLEEAIRYADIPDFWGYRAGTDGSIWSSWGQERRKGCNHFITVRNSTWKRLRPGVAGDGSLCVRLKFKGGKMKTVYVQRLVLLSFVGPCPEGMEACHFPDRDQKNCRLDNLRWDTRSANQMDKVAHGTTNRGERSAFSKLTEEIVREIRQSREKIQSLADRYGVNNSVISRVRNYKAWQHVS